MDLSRRVLVKGKVRGAGSGSKPRRTILKAASGCLSPRPCARRGTSASSARKTVSDIFNRSRLRRSTSIRETTSSEPMTPTGLQRVKNLTRRTTTNHLLASGVSDPFYAPHLTLRSIPVAAFLGVDPPIYPFPIASMSEDKLLIALGLSGGERKKIEGVQTKGGPPMDERGSEGQQFLRASFRLAMDPPSQVGVMQRRTTRWQLRPLYFRGDSNCGLLHVPAD
eukprot:7272586-Prymnesium_polylepis.1